MNDIPVILIESGAGSMADRVTGEPKSMDRVGIHKLSLREIR